MLLPTEPTTIPREGVNTFCSTSVSSRPLRSVN
jgi:hypothetical protein